MGEAFQVVDGREEPERVRVPAARRWRHWKMRLSVFSAKTLGLSRAVIFGTSRGPILAMFALQSADFVGNLTNNAARQGVLHGRLRA